MTDRMSTEIRTDIFRVAPAIYLRVVAGTSLPSLLASVALCAFLALVAGVMFDLRIILIALILIFLILPFFVFHIYYSRLLTIEAQSAVSLKIVSIVPGVEISEIFVSADESNIPPAPLVHLWDDIDSARISGGRLLIYFRAAKVPLIIPLDSMPENFRSEKLLEILPVEGNNK